MNDDISFDFLDGISDSMPKEIDQLNNDIEIDNKLSSTSESASLMNDNMMSVESESEIKLISSISANEYYKQWNGRVILIEDKDTFIAIIKAISDDSEKPKVVRFNTQKVSIINCELLNEGAAFYWTVGLFRNKRNSLVKRSEIRFKMIGSPSPLLINKIGKELEEIFDGLLWLE